jgi:hypothetical protein
VAHYTTLSDTRLTLYPSVVTLKCLDKGDEGGNRVTTKLLVNNSESVHKG